MKWTIAIVNYYSSCYIKWQMKILYKFNKNQDFQVVIVDNSSDELEYKKLVNITKKYNNIILVKNLVYKGDEPSMQHGRGIDIALNFAKYSNSSYFLTVDPDCFFLKKEYLCFLENLMLDGNALVGTQYSEEKKKKITNNTEFPCAFFCSYNLNIIGFDNSFLPCSKKTIEIDKTGKDTGYQIREKFYNTNYISFKQSTLKSSPFPKHRSFRKNFEYYFLDDKFIAVHFNKTSRNIKSSFFGNFRWNLLRSKNASICYKYIENEAQI